MPQNKKPLSLLKEAFMKSKTYETYENNYFRAFTILVNPDFKLDALFL